MMTLEEYIKLYYRGNKSAFARYMGVGKNDVYVWVRKGWIVFDGQLYLPKRKIQSVSS